jgi:uncharacterized membrane protein YozB (DUF420 family)
VVIGIGIFNASAPFLSDLNMIFQLLVVAVLFLALLAMARRRYVVHGVMMGSAVALHTISIFMIMVPTLRSLDGVLTDLSTRLSFVVVVHSIVGSVVEILGVLLVVLWVGNRVSMAGCFRRKRVMEATIFLWILEILLGFYVYITLYPFV